MTQWTPVSLCVYFKTLVLKQHGLAKKNTWLTRHDLTRNLFTRNPLFPETTKDSPSKTGLRERLVREATKCKDFPFPKHSCLAGESLGVSWPPPWTSMNCSRYSNLKCWCSTTIQKTSTFQQISNEFPNWEPIGEFLSYVQCQLLGGSDGIFADLTKSDLTKFSRKKPGDLMEPTNKTRGLLNSSACIS